MVVGGARDRQQLDALLVANDVRTRRAKLKLEVKSGTADPAELLRDPPAWLDSMAVSDLLRAKPHWGSGKVARVLGRSGVPPFATVGGLTARQRRALVEAVRG